MHTEIFLDEDTGRLTEFERILADKKVLFLDVDETLARTQEKLAELLQKKHGISVEFEKMTKRKIQYAVAECKGKFSDEEKVKACCFDVLNLEETHSELLEYVGYVELARKAHKNGIKIVALTHRSSIEKKYPHTTKKWFEKNDIPVDLFVFGDVQQKVKFLKKIDSVVEKGSAFCDDDPDTIRLCLNSNLQNISPSLVSDRPWTNPATSELDLVGLEKVIANSDDVWKFLTRD